MGTLLALSMYHIPTWTLWVLGKTRTPVPSEASEDAQVAGFHGRAGMQEYKGLV